MSGELNAEQVRAVTHGSGPLLVLAGAGSGKTRVIAHRITHLMTHEHVPPQSLLAVTFTNKAAGNMRERIFSLIGHDVRELTVKTFHALGLMILRELDARGVPGVPSRFVIYDEDDHEKLLQQCVEELGWQDDVDVRHLSDAISSAKAQLISASTYGSRYAHDTRSRQVARLYQLYQDKLASNSALDFDDLLALPAVLLESQPEVLAHYQDRFVWILVDEYQDVNHAQYRLTKLLAGRHRNLCVVGDPDQSIYTWRGADPKNILEFERDYPDAVVITLEQNYRSTQNILDAASAVIRHNRFRKEKRLWTDGAAGERIRVYQGITDRDEAIFVAATSAATLREHAELTYRDLAVLYRTHAQSRTLEDVLMERGIPYRIWGGVKFYQRKEIKDLVACLRLLVYAHDEMSWRRALQVLPQHIGLPTVKKIGEWAVAHNLPFPETLERAGKDRESVPGLATRTRQAVAGMWDLMQGLKGDIASQSLSSIVSMVVERVGYVEYLQRKGSADLNMGERVLHVREFMNAVEEFESRMTTSIVGEDALRPFFDHVGLYTSADNSMTGDAMTLMTIHNAKGLEFPVVFLTGLEEGIFPHASSLDDPHELEEERRLCYVGLTRAKVQVYCSHVLYRRMYGEHSLTTPSRFLSELPREVVEELPSPATLVRTGHRDVTWAGRDA